MTEQVPTKDLSTEVRRNFSKAELMEFARSYMLSEFGIPNEMLDQDAKDRWRERLGLLVDFSNQLWDSR